MHNPDKFVFPLQVLIDWINDVLVGERIIVKDLAEDMYDGQVLQKLFGKKLYAVGTLSVSGSFIPSQRRLGVILLLWH